MIHAEAAGSGRHVRRRREVSEKLAIVRLTMEPGASVAEIAPAHGVNANQVFKWWRLSNGANWVTGQAERRRCCRSRSLLMSMPWRTDRGEQRIAVRIPHSPSGFITDDVQANAAIHALEAQVKREQQLKENLKHAIQNAGDFDIDAALRTGRLVRFAQDPILQDPELIELARYILNAEHLHRFGLTLTEDRVIAPNRNDRVFVTKRHVKKLQSLMGHPQFKSV